MNRDSVQNQDIGRRGPEGEVISDLSRRRIQRLRAGDLVVDASTQMYGTEAFREQSPVATPTEPEMAQADSPLSSAETATDNVDPIALARYRVNVSHEDIAA